MQLALYHRSGVCNNSKRQKDSGGPHETQASEVQPYAASKEMIYTHRSEAPGTGRRAPCGKEAGTNTVNYSGIGQTVISWFDITLFYGFVRYFWRHMLQPSSGQKWVGLNCTLNHFATNSFALYQSVLSPCDLWAYIYIYIFVYIYLLIAIVLSPGGSTHLTHKQYIEQHK